jgi:hypothetical protein
LLAAPLLLLVLVLVLVRGRQQQLWGLLRLQLRLRLRVLRRWMGAHHRHGPPGPAPVARIDD